MLQVYTEQFMIMVFLVKWNSTCFWREIFQKVFLRFEEFFIEPPYTGSVCFDAVRIFDGDNATAFRPVGVYCGAKAPSDFLSSSNKVLVTFESDSSTTHRGFVAVYSTKRPTARSNGQLTFIILLSMKCRHLKELSRTKGMTVNVINETIK